LRRPFPKGKKGSDISDVFLPHLKLKLPLERVVDRYLPSDLWYGINKSSAEF
jgi:hypothetical protein